jgi:hypothetical protein
MNTIADVPEVFRPHTPFEYPRHSPATFEEHFYQYFLERRPETKRVYLPVLWSILYYNRHYRRDGTRDLQTFLNRLDRGKRYFTTCVYDGGIHEDTRFLDLRLYSAVGDTINMDLRTYRGNLGDRAIPLVCSPAPNIDRGRKRDILAGFVGAPTHPIRNMIWQVLESDRDFVVKQNIVNPVSGFATMDADKWAQVNYEGFKDLMERSIFALCPRGSSTTSFRICESLQYGCVPVYISNKFWFPWSDPKNPNDHGVYDQIGITCLPEEVKDLPRRLREISQDQINRYLENGRALYESYFSLDGCSNRIIEEVNGE